MKWCLWVMFMGLVLCHPVMWLRPCPILNSSRDRGTLCGDEKTVACHRFNSLVLAGGKLAGEAVVSSGSGAAGQDSLLVRRDLTLLTDVVVVQLDRDGIRLEDGQRIAWHEILVAQDWGWGGELVDSGDEAAARELSERLDRCLTDYGQPWYLLRSRRQRGERYGVVDLARKLLDRYAQGGEEGDADAADGIWAGQVAAHWVLSVESAGANQTNAALEHWFRAAQLRRLAADEPRADRALADWLPFYLDPAEVPVGQALGLPLHVPPVWKSAHEAAEYRPLAVSRAPQQHIYALVAAIHSGQAESIRAAARALERSLSDWDSGRRPLVRSLIDIAGRVADWDDSDESAWTEDLWSGYLDAEQQWRQLGLEPLESGGVDGDRRDVLIWKMFLEGQYLLLQSHPPQRQTAGALRWMLLTQWSESDPAVSDRHVLGTAQVRRHMLETVAACLDRQGQAEEAARLRLRGSGTP